MSKEKEILDRLENLEGKVNSRNELLGIIDCAKRDLVIQQKKHRRNLERDFIKIKALEKKLLLKIKKFERNNLVSMLLLGFFVIISLLLKWF